jgi:outer membrane receptor protein involved in Fe transport
MLSKKRTFLYLLALGTQLPRLVVADPDTAPVSSVNKLEEVTVSATRTARRIDDVPASVTVIGPV